MYVFSIAEMGEMEHEQSRVEKFTWKVENFSRFKTDDQVCSEPFVLGGYPWYVKIDWILSIDSLT